MALGSSAPEIFLSLIDLFRQDMFSSELGAFTIVGSAAFNLFVIVAVCMLVIPSADGRRIQQVPVFYLTAAFSIFAYAWLVVILLVITPGIVDIWESVVTLVLLPILIWVSYCVDKGNFNELQWIRALTGDIDDDPEDSPSPTRGVTHTESVSSSSSPPSVPASTIERASKASSRNSIRGSVYARSSVSNVNWRKSHHEARHRLMASITGSDLRVFAMQAGPLSSGGLSHSSTASKVGASEDLDEPVAHIQFLVDYQCMSKDTETKHIVLVRTGNTMFDVRVTYKVNKVDPDCVRPAASARVRVADLRASSASPIARALSSPDSVGSERSARSPRGSLGPFSLTFQTGDVQKDILIDKSMLESLPSENFTVAIEGVETISVEPRGQVALGSITSTTVNVVPAMSVGTISFADETLTAQATTGKQVLEIAVLRLGGCSGPVVCEYHTERFTAVPGYHYKESRGQIEFADGLTEQTIEVEVLPKSDHRAMSEFLVILEDIEGATFDPDEHGGPDSAILRVVIPDRGVGNACLRRLDGVINLDAIHHGLAEWCKQVPGAICVNGSLEEQREASPLDWAFHLVSLPWKLLFVLVPSTSLCGGWMCFFSCLFFIGALTGVVADLAELFGCVLSIPNEITAVTFVALGTSMPDLFASKVAAVEDPTADASVVNVTGSNSVNVFLGLGLPWTIGAIYWAVVGRTHAWEIENPEVAAQISGVAFVVKANNLGFNVLVFTVSCLVALSLLMLKRRFIGVELGGPTFPKVCSAAAFLALWVGYFVLTCWRSARWEQADSFEVIMVIGGCIIVLGSTSLASVWTMSTYRWRGGTRRSISAPARKSVAASPDKQREEAEAEQLGKPSAHKDEGAGALGSAALALGALAAQGRSPRSRSRSPNARIHHEREEVVEEKEDERTSLTPRGGRSRGGVGSILV